MNRRQKLPNTAALLGVRCHVVEFAELCVHLPASSVAGCLGRLLAANLLAGSPAFRLACVPVCPHPCWLVWLHAAGLPAGGPARPPAYLLGFQLAGRHGWPCAPAACHGRRAGDAGASCPRRWASSPPQPSQARPSQAASQRTSSMVGCLSGGPQEVNRTRKRAHAQTPCNAHGNSADGR